MSKENPALSDLYPYEAITIPENDIISIDARNDLCCPEGFRYAGRYFNQTIWLSQNIIVISFTRGYAEYYLPPVVYRVSAISPDNMIFETDVVLEKGMAYELSLIPESFVPMETSSTDLISNLIPFAMIGLVFIFVALSLISIILSRKRS